LGSFDTRSSFASAGPRISVAKKTELFNSERLLRYNQMYIVGVHRI
jgi:hypothetical protein